MGASTHNPVPSRSWRELLVSMKLAREGLTEAKKSTCMADGCKKAPEIECIWAEGRGRAWHCEKHHESWAKDDSGDLPKAIVKQRRVPNGVVGDKYGEYPDKKAGFGVGVRGTFGVQASAADGKTTGYRDSVGLFIRLPEHLAEQFPSLAPEDNSPPHVTFLYVGKVSEEQDEVFLETIHKVFAQGMPSIKAKIIGLEHFDHPDKERRVAHCAVRFSSPLSEIRSRLRSALEDAGIEVGDSFPVYRPHVTLAYMPGLDSKYDGPVPEGEWEFDEIEVWGLPKEHRVSFSKGPKLAAEDLVREARGRGKSKKDKGEGKKPTNTPTFKKDDDKKDKKARAIPIDKSALRSLTTRLEKRLSQAFTVAMRTKPDDPIRRQEVWARETHDIRNVMGHDLTVDVMVTAGKDRSGGPFVAAGGYGHNRRTNRPVVIVKLNGSYSPKEYLPAVDTGMLTRGIYDILIHEMTHAADAALKAKYKTGPASGQYVPDDISAYYNDPKEVRAYMQQVVDEVLRYGGKRQNLEKILKLFKGPRHRGIEVVLKNTETWPEIKDHLTDSNKAKILKAVYQALDDEGYLKGASMWTMTAADLVQATAERAAAYFGVGDHILYGKYKNKKGKIVGFGKDEKGNPTVEIEPVPKGRKQNKTMTVFKIWHADPEKRGKKGFVAEDGWDASGNHRVVLWPDSVDEESVIHTLIRPAFEQAGYDAATVTREMDNALGAEFLAERFIEAKAKYKDKHEDKDGNVHYEYSPKQVEHRHREKAKRVENLRTSMPKLRKQVEKDLGSDDPKTKLTALAIALIDETYERPGNDTSAADGHVGVTGWQAGQVSFGGKGATIKYTGKSGVKHEKKVTNSKIVKALRELTSDKGKTTKILSFDCEGKESCVSASDVNSYLKDFGVTAKDLRGYHANDEMKSRLRALRDKGPTLPRSRKEKDEILKKEFDAALKETAEAVGHEPATLRKDYLVPGLENSYLHNGSVEDRHTKLGADELAMLFLATKDQHEKEEDEAEKLVRKEPKKKPPREDLRKERIDADDDPDLEKPNATNDRDLSHNYKGRNARANRVLHPVEYENSMGGQFYLADIRQDRFVHFTPSSRALGILKDGKLKVNPPYQQFGGSGVYAISLVYGAYVPGTQVTHIKPDEGELVGIVFETTAVPERGYIEEVTWNRDVPLKRARIVPARQAIGMLSNTPERIGGQDQVFYKKEPWMLRSAAEKQWWEGKKFPHKSDDGKTTQVGWKSLSPEEQAKFQKERDEGAVEKAKGRQKKKQDKGKRKQEKQVASELKALADNEKLAKRIESMAKGIEDPAKLAAKYEKATGKKMSEGTAKAIVEGVKSGNTLSDIADQKGAEQSERKTQEKSEKGVRQVKRELNSLVKGADLPESVKEKLQETFRDMGPADRKAVLDSMKSRMKDNLGTVLDTDTAAGMAETTDLDGDLPDDPAKLGQELADRAYVQNVVLNPMMAGGNAVTDTKKSEGELEARASEALAHYRDLKPEHRKDAGEKILKRLKEVGEGSHEAQELNAILDGIALAGALEGENVPGRPPPSSLFTAVARGLEKRGEAASLLKATDLNSTEARDAMRRGISMLDNSEFAEATKDSELMGVLGERMNRKGTSVRAQREIRKMMEDLLMDDMTFIDPMVRDSLEAGGKKEDSLDPKKRDNIRKEIHKGVKISLGDLEGDPETVRRARRNLRFSLLEKALEKLDRTFGGFPSMAAAMARSAIKEKNLGILDQKTHDPLMRPADVAAAKPSKKESSAQSAAYTPNLLSEGPPLFVGNGTTGPESPRGIRRNETMTKLLTKKGADQIQDSINRLAHVVQNNWQALGVPTQEHAMDLAFRLDVLGDTVAKKAAQDANHIAQKLAAGPGDKQAEDATVAPGTIENDDGKLEPGAAPSQDNMTTMQNGYDPADIGKLKGPEEQDGDEPYMDAFVQDEYHQLAELQQKGMFSNAKAGAEVEDNNPKAKVLAAVNALGQAVAAL